MAHPDDETFGMAGTIARYVSEGVKVYLICATNGDVGSAPPEAMKGYSSVAEMRLGELRCAAQILHLEHVYLFGYRDSGMSGTPDNQHPDCLAMAKAEEVVGRIVQIIREVRPQVVVTFDPFGGYGHPDHIATHQVTVKAFEAAGDPAQYREQIKPDLQPYRPQKLYYFTFDKWWMRLAVRLMPLLGEDPEHLGRNGDINAREIASWDTPIHARIKTGAYQKVAQKARECHASQLGGRGVRRLSQLLSSLLFGVDEEFMRAYPPVNGRIREHDLFAGVRPSD